MPILEDAIEKIEILAGTDKDNTALTTAHYTDVVNVRFYNGKPRKLGGNVILSIDDDEAIVGSARTLYSQLIGNRMNSLIGTSSRLYALFSTELTNITPLVSDLDLLGTDPLATTNTSTTVVVTHTAHGLSNGDFVAISGADATNGIPAAELNICHQIANITTDTYEITTTTAATATGSGGGSAIQVESELINIPNSLDSHYQTLGTDPVATVSGSTTLTITSTAHVLVAGDTVDLSGATGFNGIPAGDINAQHIVRSVTTNTYTIIVSTTATGTGSGGGAAVVEASGVVTVNHTANSLSDGDRIKISCAATFAGISDTVLNIEHIIRNQQTNSYDIVVDDIATSSVTSGGGAITCMQEPIPDGNADFNLGIGYGMGKYGVGMYGTSKTSSSLRTEARIYSFDRFGSNVVFTPGGETGVYIWDADTTVAPIKLQNAPTDVDYVFVTNNIIVTLKGDRIQWSDIASSTVWTTTPINQAGTVNIFTAEEFVCHAQLSRTNLLFTENKVFTFRYVGFDDIFETQDAGGHDGIIGRNAKVVVNNTCYWFGNKDFYMYNGGIIQAIPSNSPNRLNYIKRHVFENISDSQKGKSFAWFNKDFNEIWFHYPSEGSNECDKVVRFNIYELHWTADDIDRTCGEKPIYSSENPLMIDTSNNVRKHELGVNDDTSALSWSLTSPFFQYGNTELDIEGVIPDSTQTGNITCTIKARRSIQDSSSELTMENEVTPTTTEAKAKFPVSGRNWSYEWSGTALDGDWQMGEWYQIIKGYTPK